MVSCPSADDETNTTMTTVLPIVTSLILLNKDTLHIQAVRMRFKRLLSLLIVLFMRHARQRLILSPKMLISNDLNSTTTNALLCNLKRRTDSIVMILERGSKNRVRKTVEFFTNIHYLHSVCYHSLTITFSMEKTHHFAFKAKWC